ncbi:hypothetical protein EV702DRAFT_1257170 [Suillus placidus]|uniref:ABC transmembrane type-1 domain-containing protein n=1 Tax=Suillus placidus TaxID=48579 RepID=A0A9P7CWA7_9AGAM|nr:hypothetical protein EV702DRAFT_1257170 [Suillus placidus]
MPSSLCVLSKLWWSHRFRLFRLVWKWRLISKRHFRIINVDLSDRILNNELPTTPPSPDQTQKPPSAPIRLILISRLGPSPGYNTKCKVLVPVFSVALKDQFAHARMAFKAVELFCQDWLDTPLSVFAVRLFDPPRHPSGIQALLEHSMQNYGPLLFSLIYPLITRGSNMTMNEDDVWNFSPAQQPRPVFIKFSTIIYSSLLRRLLDFCLTYVSVTFTCASPFFLKRILDAIDEPTAQKRSQVYILAFLALLCTLSKVCGSRCPTLVATRIRVELMAAIYDRALKRQDYSGIIDKDKAKEAADKKAGIKPAVGKIVSLMAVDANRIAMMIFGAYFIYGGPFEIIIATTFLYKQGSPTLLGLSAFAGFVVLLAGWPLNSYVAKRSIHIQKVPWKLGWGVYTSRDRPEAYHELLQEINEAKNDLCSRTGDGNLIFQLGSIRTGSASLSSQSLLIPSFRILTIGRANGRKTTILQGVCNTHDNPEIRNGAGEKVHLMTLGIQRATFQCIIKVDLLHPSSMLFAELDTSSWRIGNELWHQNATLFIKQCAHVGGF